MLYIDGSLLCLQVLQCVQEGRPLLLENLPEDIDAVLDPVIAKQFTRRGKGVFLKIGDTEVEADPNFRWAIAWEGITVPTLQ